jgi:hypothetical protein
MLKLSPARDCDLEKFERVPLFKSAGLFYISLNYSFEFRRRSSILFSERHLMDTLPIGAEPHYSRYIKFIETRKLRTIPEETYTERHHIVPISLGGSDDEVNIICLTAREHFIAHLILWKAYSGSMLNAFILMAHAKGKGQDRYVKLNARQFEVLRKQAAAERSDFNKKILWTEKNRLKHKNRMAGANNSFYNKSHSEGTKALIRKNRAGKTCGAKNPAARPVVCMNTGVIYTTAREATKATGACNPGACCAGLCKYSGVDANGNKLQWRFEDDPNKPFLQLHSHGKSNFSGTIHPNASPIRCTTTGELFSSAAEACKKYPGNIGVSKRTRFLINGSTVWLYWEKLTKEEYEKELGI